MRAKSIRFFLICILCLSIAPSAQCGAAKESARTSLIKFNKFQMSDRERQLLRPLWVGTMNNSAEGKRIIDRLLQSSSEEQAKEMFVVFFDGYSGKGTENSWKRKAGMLHLQGSNKPLGLALTDPNLEPTYPVPGGQLPAYLLPGRGRYEHTRSHGAALGAGIGVSVHTPYQEMTSLFERLLTLYRDYSLECVQNPNRQSLLRKQLVELSGEKAVEDLDSELLKGNVREFNK